MELHATYSYTNPNNMEDILPAYSVKERALNVEEVYVKPCAVDDLLGDGSSKEWIGLIV
ncbi:MAG: hypothetical protein ACRCXT_00500 [Paraclostridium sp.]